MRKIRINKRKMTVLLFAAALVCAAVGFFGFHGVTAREPDSGESVSAGNPPEERPDVTGENSVSLSVSANDTAGEDENTEPDGDGLPGENGEQEALQTQEEGGETAPEGKTVDGIPEEELAFANVEDYVNVREGAGTDYPVIGKLYAGGAARVLGRSDEDGEWLHIVSGNVDGYAKAEFLLYGEEALKAAEEFVRSVGRVEADRLNIREAQDVGSRKVGAVDQGSTLEVLEDCGEWLLVRCPDGTQGYASEEYVSVSQELTYAKTLEEERAEREAALAAEEAAAALRAEETAAAAVTGTAVTYTPPEITGYESSEELRAAIVEYAMQYLGNVYIHGGSSLAGGTDCSGFTCFIYADFGYSISRTPSGQLSSAGRSIDYSEIQPGDIICYTSNGGKSCTHVGLYIGDGQIIHSANSKKGVIISEADYSTIMGIKNVID